MAKSYKTWLRPSEAAPILGLSRDRVRQLYEEGKLEGVRTRYGVLVKPESVHKVAAERAARKAREAHSATEREAVAV